MEINTETLMALYTKKLNELINRFTNVSFNLVCNKILEYKSRLSRCTKSIYT